MPARTRPGLKHKGSFAPALESTPIQSVPHRQFAIATGWPHLRTAPQLQWKAKAPHPMKPTREPHFFQCRARSMRFRSNRQPPPPANERAAMPLLRRAAPMFSFRRAPEATPIATPHRATQTNGLSVPLGFAANAAPHPPSTIAPAFQPPEKKGHHLARLLSPDASRPTPHPARRTHNDKRRMSPDALRRAAPERGRVVR